MIDKVRVKRAFSRSADVYDRYASVQEDVAGKLTEAAIGAVTDTPMTILDLGAGTGTCSIILSNQYPYAIIQSIDIAAGMSSILYKKFLNIGRKDIAVTADIVSLPYRNGYFELGISNLAFQWIEDISSAFNEAQRVISKGGILAITTLGKNTFKELTYSYINVAGEEKGLPPLHKFESCENIKREMSSSGFNIFSAQVWQIKKVYPDLFAFLKILKHIGAQNANSRTTHKGLGHKGSLLAINEFYKKRFFISDGVYVTYEIILVLAEKG